MKKKLSILIALVMAISLCLVPAVASANPGAELELTYDSGQNDINRAADHPYIEWTIDGNEITFKFVNPTVYNWAFDYRVDGEEGETTSWSSTIISGGELVGQEIGPSYNIVNMPAEDPGLTKTVAVTAYKEVQVGLRLGAENDWYLDWIVFEVVANTTVGLTAGLPGIVAINVNPTDIDFGTITPGTPSASKDINVENIGTVTVDVDARLASLTSVASVFQYLKLSGASPSADGWWLNLFPASLEPSVTKSKTAVLDVPATYSARGVETAQIMFIATAAQ